MLIGQVITNEPRLCSLKLRARHERAHSLTLVRFSLDKLDHRLTILSNPSVPLGQLLCKRAGVFPFFGLAAIMKRSAMGLSLKSEPFTRGKGAHLVNYRVWNRLRDGAKDFTLCIANVAAMRSGAGNRQTRAQVMRNVLDRATANDRQGAVYAKGQLPQPSAEHGIDLDALRCRSDLHERAVEVEKQRERARFDPLIKGGWSGQLSWAHEGEAIALETLGSTTLG